MQITQIKFKLHMDASKKGWALSIIKSKMTELTVIASGSRTLSKQEQNYNTHKLEFMTLKWSIMGCFHEYLYGANLMYTQTTFC